MQGVVDGAPPSGELQTRSKAAAPIHGRMHGKMAIAISHSANWLPGQRWNSDLRQAGAPSPAHSAVSRAPPGLLGLHLYRDPRRRDHEVGDELVVPPGLHEGAAR